MYGRLCDVLGIHRDARAGFGGARDLAVGVHAKAKEEHTNMKLSDRSSAAVLREIPVRVRNLFIARELPRALPTIDRSAIGIPPSTE